MCLHLIHSGQCLAFPMVKEYLQIYKATRTILGPTRIILGSTQTQCQGNRRDRPSDTPPALLLIHRRTFNLRLGFQRLVTLLVSRGVPQISRAKRRNLELPIQDQRVGMALLLAHIVDLNVPPTILMTLGQGTKRRKLVHRHHHVALIKTARQTKWRYYPVAARCWLV